MPFNSHLESYTQQNGPCWYLPHREKIVDITDACRLIEDGMTVVLGGYTACGYSKTIAAALAARKTGGEQLQFDLVPPSFTGPEIYETLGPAGILRRCTPLIESRVMSDLANKRKLHYVEQQMTTLSKQYAPEPGNSTRYDELYNDFIDLESKLWEA